MSTLQNKVIWITGASSGIGEALTYALAQKGAKLILSSRRKEELERVKGNCIASAQPNIRILSLDLSQASTLQLSAEAAIQIFGHVDVLINNGGIGQRSLAKDTTLDVDRKIFEVDFFGTIALTKALIPHFLQRKKGHFVTIGSISGIIGTPYRTAYAAAKHALQGFFNSLRAEMWKESPEIYVTMICPGWTNTNISVTALKGDGSSQGKKDETHEHGLTPAFVAQKIVKAIINQSREIYVGGWKEVTAAYLHRFLPGLFAKIIRKAKVK
ncbi:MAG TPA: SDR family oxidoreductase [Chryseolinea sp.]|nr:SDR family oxidoreductase [Chryseolinea sp.]HPH47123.1 SDR family oxidoreductase [Chryseolinea sp.]HPM30038.1 SDR family oxidoreductase [Chryseolinea sp.]